MRNYLNNIKNKVATIVVIFLQVEVLDVNKQMSIKQKRDLELVRRIQYQLELYEIRKDMSPEELSVLLEELATLSVEVVRELKEITE